MAIAAAALSLLASVATAQDLEVGVDGSATVGIGSPAQFAVGPFERLRGAFYVSSRFALELSHATEYASADGSRTSSASTGVAVLYHFSSAPLGVKPFVRAFVENITTTRTVNGADRHLPDGAGGIGLGVKIPRNEYFAWRVEGALANHRGDRRVMLLAGFSLFSPSEP